MYRTQIFFGVSFSVRTTIAIHQPLPYQDQLPSFSGDVFIFSDLGNQRKVMPRQALLVLLMPPPYD